ncbi:MAG: hypothetical protein H6738_14150 [Alphaproteobacteria bacterium]|nr:hypothetical protein [Alphaproteobacteria bacterium]MCB9697917.1 hypothetical protein [Alphaproteobacteria bacterium]
MSARARNIALLVAVVAVAAVVLVLLRTPSRHGAPEPDDTALADPAEASAAFEALRAAATGPALGVGDGPTRVWVCLHALAEPRCSEGRGADLVAAATAAATGHPELATGSLTLDRLAETRPGRWPRDADGHDAGRFGLEVGSAVILPWEVLTLELFRTPDDDDPPAWDEDALARAIGARGGAWDGSFQRLRTVSWAQDTVGAEPVRLYRLHPWDRADAQDPEVLASAASAAADHLASITKDDGRIAYLIDPITGRETNGQNLLRHGGSAYALVQAWERFGKPEHASAARRAIGWLLARTRSDERQGPHGGGTVRYVVESSYIKLGGAALALVAIDTFREEVGPRDAWATEADELATYLLSQQLESGAFVSFASLEPGGEPRDRDSAYYPGEAVLALTLHHELTGDPRWLEAATRGGAWLGDVRDAGIGPSGRPADHWFMIAADRLHAVTGDPRWLERGLAVAEAVQWQAERAARHTTWHRDFAGGFYDLPRSTPSSIRAEGLAATLRSCRRAGRRAPELEVLLTDAVAQVLWSQARQPVLFWSRRPAVADGGVMGGVVDPTMRNDYTQHALSAFLATEDLVRGDTSNAP